MTPAEIISSARRITNDLDSGLYRTSDAEMLEYVNDFSKALARGKSGFLTGIVPVTLVTGEFQQVSRITANGLISPMRVAATGRHVKRIEYEALVQQFSMWGAPQTGSPTEWAPIPGNQFGFVVFPKAAGGEVLDCLVDAVPADVELHGGLPYGDAYRAAAVNFVAGRVLLKNTNAADIQRAAGLMSAASSLSGIKPNS